LEDEKEKNKKSKKIEKKRMEEEKWKGQEEEEEENKHGDSWIARFEVFRAVKIQVMIIWVMTQYNDVVGYQRFRMTFLPPSSGCRDPEDRYMKQLDCSENHHITKSDFFMMA
jgi:hypothetical protein